MRSKFNKFYIDVLNSLKSYSTCSRLQVAAILVKDSRILSSGYNGVAKGCKECNKIFTKKEDGSYQYVEREPFSPTELTTSTREFQDRRSRSASSLTSSTARSITSSQTSSKFTLRWTVSATLWETTQTSLALSSSWLLARVWTAASSFWQLESKKSTTWKPMMISLGSGTWLRMASFATKLSCNRLLHTA